MKKYIYYSIVAVILICMIATFSLIGCKAEEEAPTEAAEEEAPTEEVEGKKFEGQELTVIYFSGTYRDAAYLIEEQFEEITGAEVTILDAPYQTLYEESFADLITDGGAYDVLHVAYQWDGQFAPYLEPIDERIKADPELNIEDYISGVARISGIWDGVRFGIPIACDAYSMAYRTDIFETEGLTEKDISTIDELQEVAEQLTKDGMYGFVLAGEKSQLGAEWRQRYWSMGGHLMSKDWKTPLPQREIAVESLQAMMDLLPTMPPGAMAYDIMAEYNAFAQGDVAIAEIWPSLMRIIANNPDDSKIVGKWNIIPNPGTEEIPTSNELSAWELAIEKNSDVKDLAYEWIKYYSSEETQRFFLKEIGVGPTRSAIYEDPNVLSENTYFPNLLIALEATLPRFRIAQSQETMDYCDERIGDAMTGSLTAQQAIDQIVDFWTEKISNDPPEVEYSGDYR